MVLELLLVMPPTKVCSECGVTHYILIGLQFTVSLCDPYTGHSPESQENRRAPLNGTSLGG